MDRDFWKGVGGNLVGDAIWLALGVLGRGILKAVGWDQVGDLAFGVGIGVFLTLAYQAWRGAGTRTASADRSVRPINASRNLALGRLLVATPVVAILALWFGYRLGHEQGERRHRVAPSPDAPSTRTTNLDADPQSLLKASPAPFPTPVAFALSRRRPPFPAELDTVLPGKMRLSDARILLPDGDLNPNWYAVELEKGPFDRVVFYWLSDEPDPVLDVASYRFRDDRSRKAVRAAALSEFGSVPHHNQVLAERVVWPNIGGNELAIDQMSYDIKPTSEKPPEGKGSQ